MHNPADLVSSRTVPRSPDVPPLDDGRALYVDGLIALRDGRAEEAAGLLIAALRRQPAHLGMRRNLVRALLAARRFEHALKQADACLSMAPKDAELHFARGTALNALQQPAKACAALTRAVGLQPNHAPSCLNLANARADLDDLSGAERLCRRAIQLDPGLLEAHASLGFILTTQGKLAGAIEACEAALRLCPDFSQAHWNLAIAVLLSGDLRRGFAAFEWRKRHGPYRQDFAPLPGPEWDGSGAAGKTILVRAEQGLGDVIQFARYLPLIRQAGGKPVLACAPDLVPLMGTMSGVEAIGCAEPLPNHDAWIDLLSLPHVFGTTLETIPAADGYLTADPGLVETWRRRLPRGQKVGLAFAGNPAHPNQRHRSVPLAQVLPLPEIAGLAYVNLQHGLEAGNLGLPNFTDRLTDFAQTAALIQNLDLVLTVDTAVAHLAGALGKPALVLLPAAPDWRWMLRRDDSPWYRSVRLIRQEKAGDWSPALTRAFEALKTSQPVRMPRGAAD
jgi:Flp pilus assembly protein TadD